MFDDKALKSLVGKTFGDAKNIVEYFGYKARRLEPKSIVTMELRNDRINLVVDPITNIVIRASVG